VESLLLSLVQNVLRVKDRGGVESSQFLGRVLLKILLGEDVLNGVVEAHVVNESSISGNLEVVLKGLILGDGEHNLLDVEGVTELLTRNVSFSKNIVILEELE
jgi:hypothetical protein